MPWGFCKKPDLGMTRRSLSACPGDSAIWWPTRDKAMPSFFLQPALPTFLCPGKWRAGEVKGQENSTLSALCAIPGVHITHMSLLGLEPRVPLGQQQHGVRWELRKGRRFKRGRLWLHWVTVSPSPPPHLLHGCLS